MFPLRSAGCSSRRSLASQADKAKLTIGDLSASPVWPNGVDIGVARRLLFSCSQRIVVFSVNLRPTEPVRTCGLEASLIRRDGWPGRPRESPAPVPAVCPHDNQGFPNVVANQASQLRVPQASLNHHKRHSDEVHAGLLRCGRNRSAAAVRCQFSSDLKHSHLI